MAVKDRREIGKEIARLLAENRASVNELDAIFNWAKHELTVAIAPANPDDP